MLKTIHLIVEQGPDKGLTIAVPLQGARLGRSSKNDIVLVDPSLSRHHCRLFFKTGDGLWVTDLGSANDTMVNGAPIQEVALRNGDVITLGDTAIKVVNDERDGAAPAAAAPAATPRNFDLGLNAGQDKSPAANRLTRGPLLVLAALVTLLAVAVWAPKFLNRPSKAAATALPKPPAEETMEVDYEKVQADATNIFRYNLQISAAGVLSVQIDDVANNRHVRKEKNVEKTYLNQLAKSFRDAGFFALGSEYDGIQPNVHERLEIAITIGRQTHRVRVLNRVEPDVFANVRDIIERCGQTELNLWAIPFSTERLIAMGRDACLQGRKLFEEREIKSSNLAEALLSFNNAEWLLQTVDPKPDYYGDILTGLKDCKDLQKQKYDDYNFRAEQAMNLRKWRDAAEALRTLLEFLPDRADPRNQDARKKLIEAEKRIKNEK